MAQNTASRGIADLTRPLERGVRGAHTGRRYLSGVFFMFPDPNVPGQLLQERLGQAAELRVARLVRARSADPSRTKANRDRIAARLMRVIPTPSGAKS